VNRPRIFLGSSGKQARLLQAITRGLEDVADVEPWTTTFNPGLRADPSDLQVLDGGSEEERAQLIAQRLREWKSAANAF
jgi:hypothetical protein